jgi:hypothetical protein
MSEEEARDARATRSTLLAAALKPYGVRTVQVNRRGDGGSAKGLQWADLPDRSGGAGEDFEED